MEERELRKTTIMELDAVVFLSMSRFVDENQIDAEGEKLAVGVSAYISSCIGRHLRGEKIFSDEEIGLVTFSRKIFGCLSQEALQNFEELLREGAQ